MEIFETMHSIDVYRKTLTKTTEIQTGDQIRVGHYTATCQTVTPKGALFLLDQYLDEAYPMNRKNTNKGGYAESDLRETLRSKEILDLFDDWGDRMVPFDNGDLLRIPYYGEMFENNDRDDFVEPDSNEQWPLMQDRRNRLASRCGEYEWGWINNKVKSSSTDFCLVDGYGYAYYWGAWSVFGVRPAFLIN